MTPISNQALQLLRFDDCFEGTVRMGESMARHTTYRIGGQAACFIQVDTLNALSKVLEICNAGDVAWTVVGKGSNLLVADEGYDGVVIALSGNFKTWNFDADRLEFSVGAGATLARIVQEAFHQGLSGMEFAVGTPGTIGGALRMNAGSREEWIGSRVVSVTTYGLDGGLKIYAGSDIEWGYRFSSIPADEVVVECVLCLEHGDISYIRGKMEGALARRRRSQPLDLPSCGSVFRNPEGHSAGALIEQAGLKGMRCGGAQISEKHANFIVNVDNATAADVKTLINRVRQKVEQEYGIELQPEVRFLGFGE